MRKFSTEVVRHDYTPTALLGKSFGRLNSAPVALLVGQESAPAWLSDSDQATHQAAVDLMSKRYGNELSDVKLRLGGSDTFDDLSRIWASDRTSLPVKLYGSALTPFANLSGGLYRSSHYNPISNTAVVYGNVPEITMHELGHAVDFNRLQDGGHKGDFLNRLRRDAYMFSSLPENALGLASGPVTNFRELQANRVVNDAIDSQKDKDKAEKQKREAWRRLAPAYGTYASAGLFGAGALIDRHANEGKGLSELRKNLSEFVGGSEGGESLRAQRLANWLLGLGVIGTGALGGRAVAEIRNLIAGGSKKDKKDQSSRKKSTRNLQKRASFIGENNFSNQSLARAAAEFALASFRSRTF
jgi:hypothetical protein